MATPKKDGTKKPTHSEKLAEARDYFKSSSRLLTPPINRAAYSDRMAWILASMSHIAYDRFEVDVEARKLFIAKLEGGGFKLIKTFNSKETETQAFLAANADFAVLAFRGTEPSRRQDLKTDAMARRLSTIQGRVHKGFAGAYASVEKDIEKHIKSLNGLPLYITGHSLGGALATVCTQMLEHTPAFRDQIGACYTFGSPRVGDKFYDLEFKSAIYRMVNTTDIVTIVPLLAMGYIHIGDIRFLGRTEADVRRALPSVYRTFQFLLTIFKLFTPLVGDHAITEYRRKLESVAQDRNLGLYVQGDLGMKRRRFGR